MKKRYIILQQVYISNILNGHAFYENYESYDQPFMWKEYSDKIESEEKVLEELERVVNENPNKLFKLETVYAKNI